jgi:hypothetical protein
MRWWWDPFCTRKTRWVGFLYWNNMDTLSWFRAVDMSLHSDSELTSLYSLYYPDSELTSLCSLYYPDSELTSLCSLYYPDSELTSLCSLYYSDSELTSLCSLSLMPPAWRRMSKYQCYSLWLFPNRSSNPRSTTLEASTLSITPSVRLYSCEIMTN